jgi:nitroreductase
MELFEAIYGRRSIRRYKPDPVPDEAIQKILAAGFAAPSACNTRPWHFIVVTDRALLDAVPTVHKFAGMLKGARAGIVCCGDTKLEARSESMSQNVAAAIQNMLLAVHSLGLGAVWLGIAPVQDRVEGFRRIFGIPGDVTPIGMISIGYPAEEKPAYTPELMEGRVHRDRWG